MGKKATGTKGMDIEMTDKTKNRKSCRQRILLVAATVLFMVMPLYVYAADAKILSTVVFNGDIYVYIRGVSGLQQDSVIQIGNYVCQKGQLASASLSDAEISMRTLVLIDNSKSIPNERYADIQEILEKLISSAAGNEQFKIGVFSDQAAYLCDYTNDKEVLDSAIAGITYNDQDTYLSDVLYDVIAELRKEDTNACTRLLIFADGADDNAIGFPNDEVRSYISENAYPVYTVGIPAKNNSANLEIMFSFSRASGSEYFLLDGSISNEEIADSLAEDQSGICLKISPDESLKDGSNKKILLKLNGSAGSVELTANVDMPFGNNTGAAAEGEEPEKKELKEKEEQNTELPVLKPGGDAKEEKEDDVSWKVLVLAAVLIMAVVLAAAAVLMMVKRRKIKSKNPPAQNDKVLVNTDSVAAVDEKTIIGGSEAYMDDARELWPESAGNYLVLKNLDNTNIMMKVPIVDKICIGRGKTQDIVIENDKKVSRAHCMILLRGSLLYITDCDSSNGTRYEGVTVYGETPIVSGGRIEIGAHRYCVELVRQ